MSRVLGFKKKDKWDSITIYQIYMKDGIKYLRLLYETDREPMGKGYLVWLVKEYETCVEAPLEELLEWDMYYGLQKLLEGKDSGEYLEVEPQEAFNFINDKINNDNQGCVHLNFLNITSSTPCDYYFGR